MKTPAAACLAFACLLPALHAGPVESAIVAAMKITEAPNYGWLTDVVEDARSYTLEGKTDLVDNKDYSVVTMPMPARRRGPPGPSRTGGAAGEAQGTAIFRGDEKYVVETPDGWRTGEELASSSSRSRGGYGGAGGRPGGVGGPGGPRGSYPGRSRTGDSGQRAFSTASLPPSLSRPHEEIGIIVAGYTELKAEPDGVSGTLSEANAKLLLLRPGQKAVTPLKASGTFRFWLQNGALVRYQVKLDGRLAVEGREGRREVEVHQTATTTLRDVGTTKVEVPEAAKKKLGS